MAYEAYGAEAAVEAVREFLEDGTHGGTGSPADTLNDVLAARRTTLSITTSNLPDIADYYKYWYAGSEAAVQPSCSIIWEGASGEEGGDRDGSNLSRRFVHRITLAFFVQAGHIAGGPAEAFEAGARIRDAVQVLFLRMNPKPATGHTLNNGGTGTAQGRVSSAVVADTKIVLPPENDDPHITNLLVMVELAVAMREKEGFA